MLTPSNLFIHLNVWTNECPIRLGLSEFGFLYIIDRSIKKIGHNKEHVENEGYLSSKFSLWCISTTCYFVLLVLFVCIIGC